LPTREKKLEQEKMKLEGVFSNKFTAAKTQKQKHSDDDRIRKIIEQKKKAQKQKAEVANSVVKKK
jgi:hypothetical protein